MKNKWLYALLAILILSAMVLTACGANDNADDNVAQNNNADNTEANNTEEDVSDDVSDEPTEPKIITIAWTQEPDTLNRTYSNMWYMSVLTQIYSCWPWEYDSNNEPYPHMLTELPTVSEDGLVITMNLRDDIIWSDGTPITADDFVFTHQMVTDPGNAVDSVYPYDYFTVEAPDPQTVVMNFSEPFTAWMSTIWQDLMPKHVLQPVFDAEGTIDTADWNRAPTVGCGPFTFTEWESGSYLRFDKNENYWGEEANLDAVIFQIVPDDAAQTAACLAGDADVCYWPPYEDIPAFRDAGLDVVTAAGGYNEGWFFNMRDMASPGIKDIVVRQAIAMALDRDSNTDLRLRVVRPNETFFDGLPAYVDPDIEPWPYDPEGANALLDAAGYIDSDLDGIREDLDGNPLTITQGNTTKEERMNYQALAQQQLLAVGIDLQIYSYDADILFASYADGGPAAIGDLDIMQWSDVPAFPDPDTSYWLCSDLPTDENPWGYNYYICDETLDALFQAQIVEVDQDARIELFHEISKYMHDNVYYLGIWDDPDVWIISPRLTGYEFSGVTPFFNITEWDIAE